MSKISVLSRLMLKSGAVFGNDTNTFPQDPVVGQLAIKGELLYAYLTLSGVSNWYPLVRMPERYVHNQTAPSTLWTVTHNLNKTEVWYQVQDSYGQFISPGAFTKIDDNSFTVSFSEASQGKVLVLGTGDEGITAPQSGSSGPVALADIVGWPAAVSAAEVGYLDGLTGNIQDQFDALVLAAVTPDEPQTLTNKTIQDIVLTGSITEKVYEITGTTPELSADNGTIQTWTLSANSTPTVSLLTGQFILLMLDDGASKTITWPAATWVGGTPPTLTATGYNIVQFWKVGTVLYAASIGSTGA